MLPAQAGVIQYRQHGRQVHDHAPRAGGGDPSPYSLIRNWNVMLPAQAGVILAGATLITAYLYAPRAGGGDP